MALCYWSDLMAPEMRAHVASFLDVDDRYVLSLVSKREHAEQRLDASVLAEGMFIALAPKTATSPRHMQRLVWFLEETAVGVPWERLKEVMDQAFRTRNLPFLTFVAYRLSKFSLVAQTKYLDSVIYSGAGDTPGDADFVRLYTRCFGRVHRGHVHQAIADKRWDIVESLIDANDRLCELDYIFALHSAFDRLFPAIVRLMKWRVQHDEFFTAPQLSLLLCYLASCPHVSNATYWQVATVMRVAIPFETYIPTGIRIVYDYIAAADGHAEERDLHIMIDVARAEALFAGKHYFLTPV